MDKQALKKELQSEVGEWEIQVFLDPMEGEVHVFQEGTSTRFSYIELCGRMSCEVLRYVENLRAEAKVVAAGVALAPGTCVTGRIYPPGSWGDPGAEFVYEVRVEI